MRVTCILHCDVTGREMWRHRPAGIFQSRRRDQRHATLRASSIKA